MSNDQCLAKGFYQHTQIKDFISVQQYMIVRARGKKCLLLRLMNEADFEAAYIYFTLRQYDAVGDMIGQTSVRINNLHWKPGTAMTADGGIVLHENCADFTVIWNEVGSGRYRYYVKDGRIVVRYVPEEYWPAPAQIPPAKKKKQRGAGAAVRAVVAMLLLMLLLNVVSLASLYNKGLHRQDEHRNELKEEMTTQRNEQQNEIVINKGQYEL